MSVVRWVSRWRESADPHVGLDSLVARADPRAPAEERLAWLRDTAAWIRGRSSAGTAAIRLRLLLAVLERRSEARAAFASLLRDALRQRDAYDLLLETGMPREHGFVGELVERVFGHVLPEPPPEDLPGLFLQVFPSRADAAMVQGIADENWRGLLALLASADGADAMFTDLRVAAARAVQTLATQVCAASMSAAMRARMSGTEGGLPSAWGLPTLAAAFASACSSAGAASRAAPAAALRDGVGNVLLEVEQAYTRLDRQGVSVGIVYQLERMRAQLQRMGELVDLLALPEQASRVLPFFVASLVRDVHDQRSVRALLDQTFRLAARKIVERSAETGEHYITRTPGEYRAMLGHAAGGGALMAITTYVKFAISALHLAPFLEGVAASLNYAGSFVAVQLAGFTVATKQPAMTAPALAARMKQLEIAARMDAFVDEVANLVRSQVAGIIGNVFVVFPVAYLLGAVLAGVLGANPVDAAKAQKTVQSLSILGPSALFAAFTGVLLWLSSIFAGWVDNGFAFRRLGQAVAGHRRLCYVFGPSAMRRAAEWLSREVAGLAANVSLGFLLGSVPVILAFHGLPIEVRHVTLSSGQLAASVVTLGWGIVSSDAFWLAVGGIAAIGALNVGVSFALALRVALHAREDQGVRRWVIYGAILRRLATRPLSFLFPPRAPA